VPKQASTLKLFRQIHLYFGVFLSPALLFFAFTGALQTFSLHETTRGSDYKPPAWAVELSQLHKKQTLSMPVRKQTTPDKPKSEASQPQTPNAAAKPATPSPAQKSHLPMKIFFLLVSIGLFTSTLTGLYMAYKYNSNKLVVTALVIAGILIPIALLQF
jgi:uncharacterized iron-regulated membrane protein